MTVIKLSVRRKGLYAVRLDCQFEHDGATCDEYGNILLDRAACDEWGLTEGSNLSEQEFCELCDNSCYKRAHSRALWLLSARDYSQRALTDKLARDFGHTAAERAAQRMVELGFVDDERYAERLADSLLNTGTSARQAVFKLTAKGIPREIAHNAVSAQSVNPADQLDRLIAAKYARKLTGQPDDTQRVMAALARRGYSYGDIRAAIERACEESENDY